MTLSGADTAIFSLSADLSPSAPIVVNREREVDIQAHKVFLAIVPSLSSFL